jgi:hypothetical protein
MVFQEMVKQGACHLRSACIIVTTFLKHIIIHFIGHKKSRANVSEGPALNLLLVEVC